MQITFWTFYGLARGKFAKWHNSEGMLVSPYRLLYYFLIIEKNLYIIIVIFCLINIIMLKVPVIKLGYYLIEMDLSYWNVDFKVRTLLEEPRCNCSFLKGVGLFDFDEMLLENICVEVTKKKRRVAWSRLWFVMLSERAMLWPIC